MYTCFEIYFDEVIMK